MKGVLESLNKMRLLAPFFIYMGGGIMFHGKISPEMAQGIKVLRERIEQANILPSILDETLNLATWNIREFGKLRYGRRRNRAAIHYIAEILSQFDLIAITEVRDDLTDHLPGFIEESVEKAVCLKRGMFSSGANTATILNTLSAL